MQVIPYVVFNGQCEAAMKFYAACLGATIEAMTPYQGTPAAAHMPPDWLKKILHARLKVGDTMLMASDAVPGRYERPQGFSVSLQVKTPAEADRAYQALAEKGTVKMPLQETFWAARFGMLVDQFGISWMINCPRPA
jgi:PhnB protein